MSESLAGKRVLFIAPMFFGYEKLIKGELEQLGAVVDYFSDRPGADFLTKALIRVDRRFLARKIERYYSSIIEETRERDYDLVLIIRAEAVSSSILDRLRSIHSRAKFVLYLWDSMHYNPNARKVLGKFDAVLSFDRADVDANPQMQFLPLFYGREFERAANWTGDFKYDACFIGTIHTDRYKVLEQIIEQLEKDGMKVFVYCYYPSRMLFRLRSLFDGGFRRFARKYIDFKGMPLSEVVDRIAESRAVIDVNRPGQLGLTMRTIEAIGAQRLLVTTNEDIVNYEVYSQKGMYLIDRRAPKVAREFLQGEGIPHAESVRAGLSARNWVLRVLGN